MFVRWGMMDLRSVDAFHPGACSVVAETRASVLPASPRAWLSAESRKARPPAAWCYPCTRGRQSRQVYLSGGRHNPQGIQGSSSWEHGRDNQPRGRSVRRDGSHHGTDRSGNPVDVREGVAVTAAPDEEDGKKAIPNSK